MNNLAPILSARKTKNIEFVFKAVWLFVLDRRVMLFSSLMYNAQEYFFLYFGMIDFHESSFISYESPCLSHYRSAPDQVNYIWWINNHVLNARHSPKPLITFK